MANDQELLTKALDALDRLMNMFRVERALYLIASVLTLILLVYVLYNQFSATNYKTLDLMLVFGSSGLITASAARVGYFFNKSFNLISKIIEHIAGIGGQQP